MKLSDEIQMYLSLFLTLFLYEISFWKWNPVVDYDRGLIWVMCCEWSLTQMFPDSEKTD